MMQLTVDARGQPVYRLTGAQVAALRLHPTSEGLGCDAPDLRG